MNFFRQLTLFQKQNLIFSTYVLMVVVITLVFYLNSKPEWVYFRKGESQYQAKKYGEAILSYTKSLSEGKTNPKTILHLADSYLSVGNFTKAIEFYEIYLEIFPKDKEVHQTLAKAYFWNGQFEKAEQKYQEILEEK